MVPAVMCCGMGWRFIYDETNDTVNIEREGKYEFLQAASRSHG